MRHLECYKRDYTRNVVDLQVVVEGDNDVDNLMMKIVLDHKDEKILGTRNVARLDWE